MKIIQLIGCLMLVAFVKGQEAKLMLPIGHTGAIFTAVFSPDGKRIVTGSYDNTAKIWDAKDGRLLANLLGHINEINSVEFSSDGKKIVTACSNLVKVWDANEANLLFEIVKPSYSRKGAVVSFNSKLIASIGHVTIDIYDMENGNKIITLKGHTADIVSVYFSHDGSKVISASEDKTAKIWDVKTGNILFNLTAHNKGVLKAKFSNDDTKIITTSFDQTAKLWDAKTGLLIGSLLGHTDYVGNAQFSPNDQIVATASKDKTVKIWDVSTGKQTLDLRQHQGGLTSLFFSKDGKRLLSGSYDGNAKIWDIATGNVLQTFPKHANAVMVAQFSVDETKVLTASQDKTAKVWNAKTAELLNDLKGHVLKVTSALYSADGKRIFVADGNQCKILNTQNGKILSKLLALESDVFKDPSKDAKWIISAASDDNRLTIWNLESGKAVKDLKGHKDYVLNATFSQDGSKIASTSEDNTMKIWDIASGQVIKTISTSKNPIESLAFSPNGKLIVGGGGEDENSDIKIWDAENGSLLKNLKGHNSYIRSVQFSSDGKYIASASWDNSAKVWDSETGQLLRSFEHSKYVDFVQFSMDNKKIVTTCWDNTAKIWDLQTGSLLVTLNGHNSRVNTACFSKDDKYIVTASKDGRTAFWDAFTGKYLYSVINFSTDDYLVVDANGRYDGNEKARDLLYFTCGTKAIGLSQVKDQLWVPNLAERIMKGETINAPSLADLNICNLIPIVEIMDDQNIEQYRYKITPQKGGLGETILYVNGIEAKRYKPEQLLKNGNDYELVTDNKEIVSLLKSGEENKVTVKSFTAKSDIGSRGVSIIKPAEKNSTLKPHLYAVMVGVSDYKGEELDLKYAGKDATDLGKAIEASATKLLGKEQVHLYNLTTEKDHYQLPEKKTIQQSLEDIGKKATANDILLVFFAGHGVMEGEKKQFYFLTADASKASAVEAVNKVGISTGELSDWMKPQSIKAQKRILILDACNSGQAIKDLVKIGQPDNGYVAARSDDNAQQIKAIDKLNEKSGLFILSASASNQSAYEFSRYNQGLLTYALLKTIKQQPDILEDGKLLNVSKWFNAAEKEVINIIKQNGARQEPQIVSTTNFNIGIVDGDVIAVIQLPNEKALFAASNFQNSDEAIADDNFELSKLINQGLSDISNRGINSTIQYISATTDNNTYIITGRYEVKGNSIVVKANLKQNKEIKHRFEQSGTVDNLKKLAADIADKASGLVGK